MELLLACLILLSLFLNDILNIIKIIVASIKNIVIPTDKIIFTSDNEVAMIGPSEKLNVGIIKNIDIITALPFLNIPIEDEMRSGTIPENPNPVKKIAIKTAISVLEIITNSKDVILNNKRISKI